MKMPARRFIATLLPLLLCLAPSLVPVQAAATLSFDSGTLNELLAPLAISAVEVPLSDSKTVQVVLDQLKVLGIDPRGGVEKKGVLLTSVRLRVPQLGIAVTIRPTLSFHVVTIDALRTLELRFEKVELPLPLGSMDIARMLSPLRFPAESVFAMDGQAGPVWFLSRLAVIEMDYDAVHFRMSIDLQPPKN